MYFFFPFSKMASLLSSPRNSRNINNPLFLREYKMRNVYNILNLFFFFNSNFKTPRRRVAVEKIEKYFPILQSVVPDINYITAWGGFSPVWYYGARRIGRQGMKYDCAKAETPVSQLPPLSPNRHPFHNCPLFHTTRLPPQTFTVADV